MQCRRLLQRRQPKSFVIQATTTWTATITCNTNNDNSNNKYEDDDNSNGNRQPGVDLVKQARATWKAFLQITTPTTIDTCTMSSGNMCIHEIRAVLHVQSSFCWQAKRRVEVVGRREVGWWLWGGLGDECSRGFHCIRVCLFAGCLTSQQHARVSQGRICSDTVTCCHTEIEIADQTFHLTQSQHTDTRSTSPGV